MFVSMTTWKVTEHTNGSYLLTVRVLLQKRLNMAQKHTSIYDMVKARLRMAQRVCRLQ